MSETVSPYGPDDADPYAADDTKNPHEESEPVDDGDEDGESPPPKRRPGRPRKNGDG